MKPLNENAKLRGIKIKLYPTEEQKRRIDKMISLSRAVYNLALNYQNDSYESKGIHMSEYDMNRLFNSIKKDPDKQWISELPTGSIYATIHNLERGFKRFFNKQSKHPKFKSRKTAKKSVPIRSDRTVTRGKYIHISGIDTDVLAKDHKIPEGSKLYNTVVSFDGDNYYLGCCYEYISPYIDNIPNTDHPIGIDVGITNMIVDSDGEVFKYSDTTKLMKRKRRQDKRLSRDYRMYLNESMCTTTKYEDIQKSKNHKKREALRRKTIKKLSNKRMNDIHTATKRIVDKNPSAIVIENISVNELIYQNKNWISRYIPYMCFYEIHRQLRYKAEDRNIPIIVAEKNFPSTQLCNNCGERGKLDNNHRRFICKKCGYTNDRDFNAALNLRDLYYLNNS